MALGKEKPHKKGNNKKKEKQNNWIQEKEYKKSRKTESRQAGKREPQTESKMQDTCHPMMRLKPLKTLFRGSKKGEKEPFTYHRKGIKKE